MVNIHRCSFDQGAMTTSSQTHHTLRGRRRLTSRRWSNRRHSLQCVVEVAPYVIAAGAWRARQLSVVQRFVSFVVLGLNSLYAQRLEV